MKKKINWKKVVYPPNLVKHEDKKTTKDKKGKMLE